MFTEFLRFELKYRLKRTSTWVYAAVLFLLAAYAVPASAGAIPAARIHLGDFSGKVFVNSPYTLYYLITLLSYLGTVVTCALMISAARRDFEHDSYSLFFTKPISQSRYLAGRFAGVWLVAMAVFAAVALGALIALLLPIYSPGQLGPFRVLSFVLPYVVTVGPNTFYIGALFFAAAALLRRPIAPYAVGLFLLLTHLLARNLGPELPYRTPMALLDPLGFVAFYQTNYLTLAARNSDLVGLHGLFLANRALWMLIGCIAIAVTLRRFNPARIDHFRLSGRSRQRAESAAADPAGRRDPRCSPVPWLSRPGGRASATSTRQAGIGLCLKQAGRECAAIFRSIYFHLIILGIGAASFILWVVNDIRWGTTSYPLTYNVLGFLNNTFPLLILLVITIYTGELVWRERNQKSAEIYDTLPCPTWLAPISKLLALVAVQVFIAAVVMVCGILIQARLGFYRFDLPLYFTELFGLKASEYVLYSILALFIHAVVNHKYLGHFLVIVFWVIHRHLPEIGVEHNLLRYASDPGYAYSDMNGFGHFLGPIVWFKLYWAALAAILMLISFLAWNRGLESDLRGRIKAAMGRMTRSTALAGALAATVCLGLAGWILYNSNYLNRFETRVEREAWAAQYERAYKDAWATPQPKITKVELSVDLYPKRRAFKVVGTYTLVNKTGTPIDRLLVTSPDRSLNALRLAPACPHSLEKADSVYGSYIFRVTPPLAPNASLDFGFEIERSPRGFTNDVGDTAIVDNGSFLYGPMALPHLGYWEERELKDPETRRRHGLSGRRALPSADAPGGRMQAITTDADWVDFEATVSTDPDQTAIAPGELVGEWRSDGRRFFHYRSTRPVPNLSAFLSARYAVTRDRWKDVSIEVYHHPGHRYNVGRMISAAKASLEYSTSEFGAYPHKHVRIVEFPRFARFAQSFPGTIAFSESAGFIAWVQNADAIDVPFAVTAHEMAHEWWGHQLMPARVRGARMLAETLAQYSALMVLRKTRGVRQARRLLRYELDDYFWDRGFAGSEETLVDVQDQRYVAYLKGRLAMNSLERELGEEKVNGVLAGFLKDRAFQGPPYPAAVDFVSRLKAACPDQSEFISDLFERITVYDNRVVAARWSKLGARYQVTMELESRKIRLDSTGAEQEVKPDDWVDVCVFDREGRELYACQKRLKQAREFFTVVVNERPEKAGIDPYLFLIDQKPENNVLRVAEESLTER